MADTHTEETRITYSRLNKALITLGFVRKKTEEFTAYKEAAHDALIVLPNMRPNAHVGDPHLVTVRNTVMGKGITSADEFQTLLVSPRATDRVIHIKTSDPKPPRVKPRKPLSSRLVSGSAK